MALKAYNGGHSMHALAYHLVWCTKYRRDILTIEIGDRVKEIISQIATEQGCEIISIETDIDHVHILIRVKPTHTLSKLVQLFKGRSAYILFREYPEIRQHRLWGGHWWSPSYYAATVGGAPLDTIKKYVESQRDPK